jgi:hypothetical protein
MRLYVTKIVGGQRFGHWTVLSRAESDRHRNIRWVCKCDCGVTRNVLSPSLLSGRSRSCRNCATQSRKATQGMEFRPLPSQAYLRECFDYDPETGVSSGCGGHLSTLATPAMREENGDVGIIVGRGESLATFAATRAGIASVAAWLKVALIKHHASSGNG